MGGGKSGYSANERGGWGEGEKGREEWTRERENVRKEIEQLMGRYHLGYI